MAEVLENGDIYFLYRPRVGDESVKSLDEVQRLLIVLHPWRGRPRRRLLVVGRKRLPRVDEHERLWAFVDTVAERPEQLHEALNERTYMTKTRGQRWQPAARPAAEGAYVIARHDNHTHLAYRLRHPSRTGASQRDLSIEHEASYIVAVRNPHAPPPARMRAMVRMGAPLRRSPELPVELRERFGSRRFVPLDPPDFLDYAGVEIVIIGAARDTLAELGLDLTSELERAARTDVFEDLRISPDERPVEPLFAGDWR
jgi:hypothetical protein